MFVWMPTYLLEVKGYEDPMLRNLTQSIYEFVGLGGMLLSGFITDKFFSGKRLPVVFVFIALLISAVLSLLFVKGGWYYDFILIGIIGFFIYGPQVLLSMSSAEFVDKRAAGTANGFLGIFSGLGTSCAGAPLGALADAYGWNGFFMVIVASCFIIIALLTPLMLASMRDITSKSVATASATGG